jgi:hypothetical protein
MVRPINQQNVDRSSPQGFGSGEAAKATSNNHNNWNRVCHLLLTLGSSLISAVPNHITPHDSAKITIVYKQNNYMFL